MGLGGVGESGGGKMETTVLEQQLKKNIKIKMFKVILIYRWLKIRSYTTN